MTARAQVWMSYDLCPVHLFLCISVCAAGYLGPGTDMCNHGRVCAQGYGGKYTCVHPRTLLGFLLGLKLDLFSQLIQGSA